MNFLKLFLPDKKEQRLSMIAKLPPEQQQCYKGDGSGLDVDAVWEIKIPLLQMNNREYYQRYKQRRKIYEQRHRTRCGASRKTVSRISHEQ